MERRKVYICIGIICILCLAFYLFGRADVSGDGNPAERAGESINRAADGQRRALDAVERIGDGLEQSEGTVSRISERNREAADAVDRTESRIRDGAALARSIEQRAAECLGVCTEIRKQKETN